MLDVFMLSFGEPDADDNFKILQEKAPHAKRIDGIEGLLNAHKACAEESRTSYFYVSDPWHSKSNGLIKNIIWLNH